MSEIKLGDLYTLKLPVRNGVDLHIIGCGGTGGYLIQNIARVAKVKNEEGYPVRMFLYDADTVENKNLVRQNFSLKDVGKNKAECMAAKVSGGFQVPAKAFAKYIETEADVQQMLTESYTEKHFPIIVGCVDSMQCRKIIDSALKADCRAAIWADAGNEEFYGQVIVASTNGMSLEDFAATGNTEGYFNLPSFVDIAPQLFEGNLQKTSEISCAEHALENVQNIGANILSATCLFMVLNNLIAGSGISSGKIMFNASIMNALNHPITL